MRNSRKRSALKEHRPSCEVVASSTFGGAGRGWLCPGEVEDDMEAYKGREKDKQKELHEFAAKRLTDRFSPSRSPALVVRSGLTLCLAYRRVALAARSTFRVVPRPRRSCPHLVVHVCASMFMAGLVGYPSVRLSTKVVVESMLGRGLGRNPCSVVSSFFVWRKSQRCVLEESSAAGALEKVSWCCTSS